MGMFSRYEKVGKGISKNPDDKLPAFQFFEIYFSHLSKLILLNFMYIVAMLPFALIMLVEYYFNGEGGAYYIAFYTVFILLGAVVGPATCGFTKVCRNISCRRPTFLWHDFWKAFKSNFKQGAIVGMIDMAFVAAVSTAFPLYYNMSLENSIFYIPFLICLICSIMFLMMHFYIYLLVVSTNLSVWKILKNSFFLIAIEIKTSLINLIVTALFAIFILVFFPFTSFLFVVVPSFLGLMYSFNCFPHIRKYVIQPWYDQHGEQNPEFEYMSDNGEAVFVDTPETEVPPEEPKTNQKKKRIR